MTKKRVRCNNALQRKNLISMQFYWLCITLLFGGIFLGCQKSARDDYGEGLVAKLEDSATIALKQMMAAKSTRRAFYQKVMASYGRPHWGHVLTAKGTFGEMYLIPFVRVGEQEVSAILACEAGKTFRMKIIEPGNLRTFPVGHERDQVKRTILLFNFLLWPKQPNPREGINFKSISKQEKAVLPNARDITFSVTTCYGWSACTGDGNGNCVENITYHVECITEVYWAKEFDYIDNGGYTGGEYGGGIGGGGVEGDPALEDQNILLPPTFPIYDVNTYLSCFDQNQPAKITFYADQPSPGSDEPFTILGKMGHAFVALEQTVNGNLIRRYIGFHPANGVNPFNQTSSSSMLGNDQARKFDVSLSVALTSEQMGQVLAAIYQYQPTYDIERYNCVDFVLDIAQAGGLSLPRTTGWWIFGRGRNPGSFGEDLRLQPDAIFQTGTAPTNSGDCH